MNEEKSKMDPKAKAIAILFLLLVIGVIIGVVVSFVGLRVIDRQIQERLKDIAETTKPWVVQQIQQNWNRFAEMYTMVTIIICMNLTLLVGLLKTYIKSFKETSSTFLMGLVLFIGVLFVQSLLILPIIQHAVGQTISDIGLFNVIPNLFETLALIILYYLSSE
jgi:p-aminobenzoyl-glutamate transporter AbgT